MRVLVDEGMPVQVLSPLRLNKQHEFDHIDELKWKGKHDIQLFADAAARSYDAVLTLDLDQLDSAEESRSHPLQPLTPNFTPDRRRQHARPAHDAAWKPRAPAVAPVAASPRGSARWRTPAPRPWR